MPRAYSADLRRRVSKPWKRELRDGRRPNVSRLIRARGCAGCNAGTTPANVRRNRAEEALLPWNSTRTALIDKRPDLTLEETVAELLKVRIRTSKSAVSRFFQRHEITFKKRVSVRRNSSGRTWPPRAGAGFASKACLIQSGWYLSTRLRSPPRWSGFGAAVHAASS